MVRRDAHEVLDCTGDALALHAVDVRGGNGAAEHWVLRKALEALGAGEIRHAALRPHA